MKAQHENKKCGEWTGPGGETKQGRRMRKEGERLLGEAEDWRGRGWSNETYQL